MRTENAFSLIRFICLLHWFSSRNSAIAYFDSQYKHRSTNCLFISITFFIGPLDRRQQKWETREIVSSGLHVSCLFIPFSSSRRQCVRLTYNSTIGARLIDATGSFQWLIKQANISFIFQSFSLKSSILLADSVSMTIDRSSETNFIKMESVNNLKKESSSVRFLW